MTAAPSAPADAPPTDPLGRAVQDGLSLDNWRRGPGLEDLLTRVGGAVADSVRREAELRDDIRGLILAELPRLTNAPAAAGVYAVPDKMLRAVRRQQLLAGRVTACDGAGAGHDGLTAAVAAVGVCLVRYDGTVNSWRNTFLRTDYRAELREPIDRLRAVLNSRGRREPLGEGDGGHMLLRRGFMAAAERQALLERADTPWRMGHGVPAPVELLASSGCPELLDFALPILERLLLDHPRWVFLPETTASRALLTVANALRPGEVAVLQKGSAMFDAVAEQVHCPPEQRQRLATFARKLGEASVVGGFRATGRSPAQLFVAPAGRAVEAGVVALADGTLSPARGFPLLLQLARLGATSGLGLDSFGGVVEAAYARARGPHLFGGCGE